MRPIGYSDKIFYYNSSGNALTYDFQMRITLTAAPNKDALQRAARKTLAAFPEFAVRPVIHDGKIFYEENFSDVAIFDAHKPHALGSDETNGYLLCLICGAREIILSFYHGLSDFVGNWSFICTLIYNYARELGFDFAAKNPVRLNADDYFAMDVDERDDPYSKFADENSVPTWIYKSRGAFRVPEKIFPPNVDRVQNYEIEISVADMIAATEKFQTSVTPLLTVAVSRALKKIYDTNGLPIVGKVPANLRPIFKTNTFANFSDSIILEYADEMDALTFAQCCQIFRRDMKLQLRPENFAGMLAKKIRRVISYEQSGKNIEDIARELSSTPSSRPITFALTYPGILDLPAEYKKIVRGFNMEPYLPIDGFFLFVGAYDDNRILRVRCCQRFDSDRVAKEIAAELERLNFKPAFKDSGTLVGDKIFIDKLKHV